MSSMTSYSVGKAVSREQAFKSWNEYFKENEQKLMKELKNDTIYQEHRELNILSNSTLDEIQHKLKSIYSIWKVETVSASLRSQIIKDIDNFILQTKMDLKKALLNDTTKEEIKAFVNQIEEEHQAKNIHTKKLPEDYSDEINLIINKLQQYDISLYNKNLQQTNTLQNTSSQKAKLFLDSLKLDYGKAKTNYLWTQVYQDSIKGYLTQLSSTNNQQLLQEIQSLLLLNYISEDTYNKIFIDIHKELELQIDNSSLSEQIIFALEELNYLIIDNKESISQKLTNQEKVTLPVKNQDYQVVIRLNKENKILTRFVKSVANKKEIDNITTSTKLKDNENLKKWCKHQKIFMDSLKKSDMAIEQEIIEDDESDILYIVDNTLAIIQNNSVNQKKVNE